MSRQKVKLTYIENYAKRNASFRKSLKGFLNKVKEIHTLCDVEACAIIYGPNDTEPHIWPSVKGVYDVMFRLYAMPLDDRTKKMVDQYSFTHMRSKKVNEKIKHLQGEIKLNEAETFVHKCLLGITSRDQMRMGYNDEMSWVMYQKIRDFKSVIGARGESGFATGAEAPTSEVAASGEGLHQVAPPTFRDASALLDYQFLDQEIWEPMQREFNTLFQPD